MLTFLDSLQLFANDIINTVNVDEILPVMLQEGLVTSNDYEYLNNSHYSMSERRQKLSNIILGLPEDCVDKFLHCLKETSYYEPHKQLHAKLYESLHMTEV